MEWEKTPWEKTNTHMGKITSMAGRDGNWEGCIKTPGVVDVNVRLTVQ